MVKPKVDTAIPATNHTGHGSSASTENAAVAKQASVTSSARSRPRQLSSVSAMALAMMPRKIGVTSGTRSSHQHTAMAPLSAMNTRTPYTSASCAHRRLAQPAIAVFKIASTLQRDGNIQRGMPSI